MPSSLLVIAQHGYQDHELLATRQALLDAGFTVTLASTKVGACSGKLGGTEEAAYALRDIDVRSYDRIAFIGGPGAAALAQDPDALRIAREAAEEEILLGAICIAPTILAAAGVLQGKRATVWDDGQGTQKKILASAGAHVVDAAVVVDGLIVTGNGPAAAGDFGRRLAVHTSS